ncbi:MAG: EF-hand domain-containing protein [Magnetospirillum sp.]|nr:EF-hand domain-containing protein [Magnetospirillum sp.]
MGSSISSTGFGGMPSAAQMAQMREKMFSKADANSDGSIDKTEFAKGAPQGADSKKTDEMFAKIDSDGNGKISKDESTAFDKKMSAQMQSMMLSVQSSGSAGGPPDLSQLFEKADSDKDGKLSKAELTSAAEQMQSQFKTSLLSAQEEAQTKTGRSSEAPPFPRFFDSGASAASGSDAFSSLMMKQLQAV